MEKTIDKAKQNEKQFHKYLVEFVTGDSFMLIALNKLDAFNKAYFEIGEKIENVIQIVD